MSILFEQVKAREQAVIKNLQKMGLVEDAAMDMELGLALLCDAVDAFGKAMKARLHEKLLAGYSGWNDPAKVSSDSLREAISDDARDMDLNGDSEKAVDIANRCMMLWRRREE